ncbi:hypothetical protein B0H14DRAFT_3093896 [Mycena olivaceomarginata]|nr:hypothetical protein B0H14DRAFT_3093896 [Mycena olivaceomarginata]
MDPFYGYEYIAQLSGQFITHLFACPPFPPQSTHSQVKLPYFIVYALHHTNLHQSVIYAVLVLLQRLKARFPTAHSSSDHHLFISTFLIVSKGMFTLQEINQMECEMCNYFDWELTVDDPILSSFEAMVQRDKHQGDPDFPDKYLCAVQ